MNILHKCLTVAASVTASCFILGHLPTQAITFTFSGDFGVDFDDPDYDVSEHGVSGRNYLSGIFTAEDLNGNGWFTRNEISEFSVTWGELSFGLKDLRSFFAGYIQDEPRHYGEDTLIRQLRLRRGNLHLDYRPFGPIGIPDEWFQKFRVYRCPAGLDCINEKFDDFFLKGLVPDEHLLGLQNIFNPGLAAFETDAPIPTPTPTPTGQSVPEPSLLVGLAVVSLAIPRKRR